MEKTQNFVFSLGKSASNIDKWYLDRQKSHTLKAFKKMSMEQNPCQKLDFHKSYFSPILC